jgi:hypothetical protein
MRGHFSEALETLLLLSDVSINPFQKKPLKTERPLFRVKEGPSKGFRSKRLVQPSEPPTPLGVLKENPKEKRYTNRPAREPGTFELFTKLGNCCITA